jgi:hypothetical protein
LWFFGGSQWNGSVGVCSRFLWVSWLGQVIFDRH